VAPPVLVRRALNRALLARQLLLQRSSTLTPGAVVEHLVGMQAQLPSSPYLGLWSRIADFDPSTLATLLAERQAVRIVVMRSTIHLTSSADALWLRALMQPKLEQGFRSSTWNKGVAGADLGAVAEAGRRLVADRALSFVELGRELSAMWPDLDPASLAQVVRNFVPMVQVPPRGLWGKSGPVRHQSLQSWLERPLPPHPSPVQLVTRYLAAFGPASVADVQNWSGLTHLREVVEQLGPNLTTWRDEGGATLYDLPDGPRPEAYAPAPVRFLPEFDNVLLGHADRSRIISAQVRARIAAAPFLVPGSVLVDGEVAVLWKLEGGRRDRALRLFPLRSLSDDEAEQVEAEGRRMVDWSDPGAAVRWDPGPTDA
jgi:hypothetical protein